MKCIFCKQHSGDAKSIEHTIPESIGNKKYFLERGVVCDQCNNYFSREVEGSLLSHISFRNLRAWYQVPTKKGAMPRMRGFVAGTDIEIGFRLRKGGGIDVAAERQSDQGRLEELQSREDPLVFMFPREFRPPKTQMSRFLAKMGLETLALRFAQSSDLLNMLVDESHYDPIRNWARRGNAAEWPYHERQVFPEETFMRHPVTGAWVQAGYGHDLLMTKRRETFFVFGLYGYEFAINLGGPSIRGYEEWLVDNRNISPLVERIGLKLRRRVKGREVKFYLVGQQNVHKARKLDRKQMKAAGALD